MASTHTPGPRAGTSGTIRIGDRAGARAAVAGTSGWIRARNRTRRAGAQAVSAVARMITYVRTQAPGWVGGALAGVQGALFSLALVLIPVWVIVASAADADVSWGSATGVATRVWLTGFAVPWAVQGVPISVIPLGIPALTSLMLAQLARRFASATWIAGLAATVAFVVTVGTVASIAWADADDAGGRVVRAALVATLVGAPSISWGILRQKGATLGWLGAVPSWLAAGVRLACAQGASVVVLASATLMVSTVAGRHTIADAATSLGVDTAGGLSLALLETLYAPTMVLWVVSWLSGAGYLLGGLVTSSAQPSADTVAALPLLGALPTASGGWLALTPVVIVALGAVVAVMLGRRLGVGRQSLYAVGCATAVVGAATAIGSRLATGSMGPGSLGVVGPHPVIAALMLAAELGAGALLVVAARGVAAVLVARSATAARPRSAQIPHRETPSRTAATTAE